MDISNVPRQTLADDKIAATVQGVRISNINLNDYKAEKGGTDNIELLSDEKEFIEIGLLANGTDAPRANTLWKTAKPSHSGAISGMTWKSETGVSFARSIKTSNDYVISVIDQISNQSKKPIFISQYSRIVRHGGAASKFAVKTGGIANIGGGMKTESWDDISNQSPIYQTGENQTPFVGFSDQYWQIIVSSGQPSDKTVKLKQRADKLFQAEIAPEFIKIEPGRAAAISTEIFAGPKTQKILAAAAGRIQNIDRTLDYGWFGFLSRPFLWTLEKLYDIIPNYGIAIILLTLIIRGLMWPLTRKSYRSMHAMQAIQPEMKRIQSLYANDKMRMQQEIMRLYQTHKANPLSSIGTMFLQIPIFFALYKALLIAVPLRHAGFLWLEDLSVMDPYFILPALMAITMFVQNKLSHNAAGDVPGMKAMKYMPFIFAVLFAMMPSGLVLYWTISSMVGAVQTWIMKKGEKK
jgi:YidC/Oxa1 family membrane protein insertase